VSDARRRILGSLRRADGAGPPPAFEVRRFDWSPEERLQRFRDRMEAVRGEVRTVGAVWPEELHALLRDKGANNLLYGPGGPLGAELERGWPADGPVELVPYVEPVEVCRDRLFAGIDAAFTGCRGAVAETGSLVLWPTAEEPRLMSLVPPAHVVLLEAGAVRSTFAELLAEQDWAAGMPTNALLISGPSKSADIEQTLAYGVHGPRELIVLVREG
jgi:L-lactate dehydrogenase complex protein LldG